MTLAFLAGAAPRASASLVFAGTVDLTGFGFGNAPRDLTVDNHNASTTELGCIAPNGGGGLLSGASACGPDSAAPGGNEANPIGFPKQAAPSVSSLGITNANQIGVIFDAVQPQNNSLASVDDVTLKLYNSAGTLLASASGSHSSLTTPGNGSTDYLFTLDTPEAAEFNALLSGGDFLALDAKLSFPNVGGGPESFAILNIGGPPTCTGNSCVIGGGGGPLPEPASIGLLGGGIAALGAAVTFGRRRRSTAA